MNVKIGVHTQLRADQAGFGQAMVQGMRGEDASATLRKLHNYIRDAQGNLRTGDIRIVNTTNAKELAFQYKSFGWGQQHRVDRTAQALTELLSKAGVPDAQAKVDGLLKNQGEQGYRRLNADALNTLLSSPDVRAKIFKPAEQVQWFLKDQGYRFSPTPMSGGQGAAYFAKLGAQDQVVKLFTQRVGDQPEPQLKPQLLDGKRHREASGDYFASYLATSKNPDWKRPLVIAPSAYIVRKEGAEGFETLSAQDVRAQGKAARAGKAPPLRCVGLVMNKAPGTLLKSIDGVRPGDAVSVGLARSGLQTLRSLNERGLIHRDIKPENMSYDSKRQEAHFFDTGLMFKTHKPAEPKKNAIMNFFSQAASQVVAAVNMEKPGEQDLPDASVGTSGYLHPRVAQGEPCGSQADLHSFALTLLEKTYPGLKTGTLAQQRASDDPDAPKTIAGHELMPRLRLMAQADSRTTTDARAGAQRFIEDVQNPNSYAHFIHSCLMKAETDDSKGGITPAKWANRSFSNRQLDELMQHPALRG